MFIHINFTSYKEKKINFTLSYIFFILIKLNEQTRKIVPYLLSFLFV